MALGETDYQNLIVLEVGDDADGTLAANIATLWAQYAGAASDTLHFLYAKQSAIDLMLGRVRQHVDIRALDGAEVKLDQLSVHLLRMRAGVDALIAAELAAVAGGPAAGPITATAPVAPPCIHMPDANDRAYRGDAYRRRMRPGRI